MTLLDRRSATLLALFSPFAAASAHAGAPTAAPIEASHPMSTAPAAWSRPNHIAMLVYPRMTALDLIGPQYMFAALMGATVHLVGRNTDPVTSDTGVTILPTATFDTCPRDVDVLFAPGGTEGTLGAMRDPATRAFKPNGTGAECGYACHTGVSAKDYIFTAYPAR